MWTYFEVVCVKSPIECTISFVCGHIPPKLTYLANDERFCRSQVHLTMRFELLNDQFAVHTYSNVMENNWPGPKFG